MIKLKDPRSLIYNAFQACEIDPCNNEAEKIWTDQEVRIIDVCGNHYKQLESEKYKS